MRVVFELREDQRSLYKYLQDSLIHHGCLYGNNIVALTKPNVTRCTIKKAVITLTKHTEDFIELIYDGPRNTSPSNSITIDLLTELFPSTCFREPTQYEVGEDEQRFSSIPWNYSLYEFAKTKASIRERLAILMRMIEKPDPWYNQEVHNACIDGLGPENRKRIALIKSCYERIRLTQDNFVLDEKPSRTVDQMVLDMKANSLDPMRFDKNVMSDTLGHFTNPLKDFPVKKD